MKEKELSDMKSLIEKKCLDRRIINNGMEEFLKLRSDVNKIYNNSNNNFDFTQGKKIEILKVKNQNLLMLIYLKELMIIIMILNYKLKLILKIKKKNFI